MSSPDGSNSKVMMSATLEGEALLNTLKAARGGDRSAADRLARAHEGWLRSVIFGIVGRAELIDDIAQQVWAQAWARLDSLEDPARLRPWLYSIARHAAIDAGIANRRRSARTQDGEALGAVADARPDLNPAIAVLRGETREMLMQAIRSLPAIYREPFALRHLEDWSYAQIGELLGLPLETVETRLVRARRLLRETLVGRL